MSTCVDVIIKEDDSVNKLLTKKAKSLHKKYSKKRTVNEKLLKPKTPLEKVLSIMFDIVCFVLVVISAILGFAIINSRIQNTCVNVANFTNMQVVTGSMQASHITIDGVNYDSGHAIGDNIVVRSVQADTLRTGDKIAFYVYSKDYSGFNINTCIKITNDMQSASNKFSPITFKSLFGFQSTAKKNASNAGANIVFHHIKEIYEDDNGVRWFKTRGSSNNADDSWYISENMVIGVYDEGGVASFMRGVLNSISSMGGITVLIIPVILMGIIIVMQCLKSAQLAKLELDCVEEKRKITDDICVRNNIGFNMSNKTKYKVLAQADETDKMKYISLLWKDGSTPASIKKYYMRKRFYIRNNQQLLQLNRKCEDMFNKGVSTTKIAKYYSAERAKIDADFEKIQRRLKAVANMGKNTNA